MDNALSEISAHPPTLSHGLDPALHPPQLGEFNPLEAYLLDGSRQCLRPPVDRFQHAWLAPMALSAAGNAYLSRRAARAADGGEELEPQRAAPAPGLSLGDGFTSGDYSLGLFHHDASEASIELLRHEAFREGAAGSLLCLLDCAAPSGLIHRIELTHKSREAEPSKPVMAAYALRIVQALGQEGPEWAERHRVLPRILAFLRYLELNYTGLHGLMLSHSALATGFDSDVLTAGLPDRSVEGPDTNAFMVLEYQAAAALSSLLGRERDAGELLERAERLTLLMERLLWYEDERGGMYVALRWQHGVGSLEAEVIGHRDPAGRFRPIESWTTLLPLYAGIPSPPRAALLVSRMLDPEGYWGPQGVRTAPADDVYFHQAPRVMLYDFKKNGRGPVSNWSGPVWVLSNYYMACGLARYGYQVEACELALKTARLLKKGLEQGGTLHECYNDAGQGLWPRNGTFMSWNVLALTLLREHWPASLQGGSQAG